MLRAMVLPGGQAAQSTTPPLNITHGVKLVVSLLCLHAGLLHVGDSTFPGIGVPAVAASGAIAANTLASPWQHWRLLDEIGA